MEILLLKTDSAEAWIAVARGREIVAEKSWQAGRQLSMDLLKEIESLLAAEGLGFENLGGVAVFKGPGSFTGLRIGITVANAIAYAQDIPVVSETGDDWMSVALQRLEKGENESVAQPFYGAEANITKPKK